MRQDTSLLLLALSAAGVLAAPACKAGPAAFKVPVKPQQGQGRNPTGDMQKAAHKYGFSYPYNCTGSGFPGPAAGASSSLGSSVSPAQATTSCVSNIGSSTTASMMIYPYPTATSSVVGSSGPYSNGTVPHSTFGAGPTALPSSTLVQQPSATASASGSSGNVQASPEQYDSEYLSPVTIGGQTLNLNFDSGSADLWVFSTELSQSTIGQHAAFNPSKSPTWTLDNGSSWHIGYGDGSGASGLVGFDRVQIGSVAVQRQAVEIATSVSSEFVNDVRLDGILGLGFSKLNTIQPQQQKTFFENVKDKLKLPVFTADLEEDASGTYEFGAIDSSKYEGDITYATVDPSSGFWSFSSQSARIGEQTYNCGICSPALADTGTSLLLLDSDLVNTYWSQVKGATFAPSGFQYPCGADLPDLSIAVGDNFFATIPGSAMEYAPISGGTCFGSLQPANGAQQVLGLTLFKQYFAVFDGADGAPKFGLAKKSAAS